MYDYGGNFRTFRFIWFPYVPEDGIKITRTEDEITFEIPEVRNAGRRALYY